MLIKVEQCDIDSGIACDCEQCPVARALMRQVPGCVYADVRDNRVKVHYRDKYDVYCVSHIRTTHEITDFYSAFDDHRHVEPFEFEFPLDKDIEQC